MIVINLDLTTFFFHFLPPPLPPERITTKNSLYPPFLRSRLKSKGTAFFLLALSVFSIVLLGDCCYP